MISRIEGTLITIEGGRAELNCGDVTYELLIPACDEMRLSSLVGTSICFHTLHYLEGQGQGSSFIPRLIGFSTITQRRFFELFTTVKGLGSRKALRALQLPYDDVARAIATKDLSLLVSLPEIGKRTAETIIAQLHGKVDRFIELKPDSPSGSNANSAELAARLSLINDASMILVQLGEQKIHARQLVDRALEVDPTIDSADDLVAAAFRLKELG